MLSRGALVAVFALLISGTATAQELILTIGGGSQPHADQTNRTAGVDLSFLGFRRSDKQLLQIGISYTQIRADTDSDNRLWSVSVYPQLTLFPEEDGRFRQLFPRWAAPYFFVRALAPSYLSATKLGEREQENHFAFQAQAGFGLELDLDQRRRAIVALSWKHFSNANLFETNDGIDMPLVLSLGLKF